MVSMESGADFIKTSTGKIQPAATLESVLVMCHAIKAFMEQTGRKVGIKPAGGISTAEQALDYASIVKGVLGDEWLNPELFRIGASRLANNLLSEISSLETGKPLEVSYF
jgi:deoxyribose-phosphate aldolase